VSRRAGISEQQLADLHMFEESSAFTEREKLVLRYALAMSRTPTEVSEELFQSLREHFDPRQDGRTGNGDRMGELPGTP
jgi:4-carboxymuconolactone decarboxylase